MSVRDIQEPFMYNTLTAIQNQIDKDTSDDVNLQHLLHMFEGYRDWCLADRTSPYSPDSARDFSWKMDSELAYNDHKSIS